MKTFRPTSAADLASGLADGEVAGRSVAIRGAGTKQGWLLDGPAPDAIIDTTALSGLDAHPAGELVCTVGAGTRFGELQRQLARYDQRVALDPPSGPEATLGGIFSADEAGPGRIAHGSLREQVVGVEFVLASGARVRSGGWLARNVAGYDACKLLCGARGALGVVTELTLRLQPLPPCEGTLRIDCAALGGVRSAVALGGRRARPTAMVHQDGALWIRFEGGREAVDGQIAVTEAELRFLGEAREYLGDDSRTLWAELLGKWRADGAEIGITAGTRPDRLASLGQAVGAAAARNRVTVRIILDPRAGALLAFASGDVGGLEHFVLEAREDAERSGGQLRLRDRGRQVLSVDREGRAPGGAPLMRRLKRELDPTRALMPGLAYQFLETVEGLSLQPV